MLCLTNPSPKERERKMEKTIYCTKQDAQEQIRLIFGALPLDARRFNLDAIAERCAELLEQMTINQTKSCQ